AVLRPGPRRARVQHRRAPGVTDSDGRAAEARRELDCHGRDPAAGGDEQRHPGDDRLDDEFGAGLQDRADDLDEEESEDADEEEDGRSLAENHRQALRGGMILCRAHGRSPSISSTVQTLWAVGPGYSSKRSMLSQIEGRSMGI